MNWISIISLVIGVLSLVIAYYRYMRNHPKLEVIDVCETSTSAFKDYINDIEFSYKDKVYKELTSIKLLVVNRSFRSIEKEDIRVDDQLQLYSEGDTQIHDVRVLREVGNSIKNLEITDSQTISLDISSMDIKSSFRIEVLGSGEDFEIKGRGKLINANYSISKIKKLKKRLTFKEMATNGADIFKGASLLTIFLIPVIFIVEFGFVLSDTRSEVIILAPEEFLEAKNQFVILDSLQEDSNVSAIELLSFTTDSVPDTIEISTKPTAWSMNWSGGIDSIASKLRDSLMNLGYDVYYGAGYEDDQELINSGEYVLLSDLDSKYQILKKKLTGSKALRIFGESFQVGLYLILFFLGFLIVVGTKTIRKSFKYRRFITESEREDILKKYRGYDPARLFFWILFFRK